MALEGITQIVTSQSVFKGDIDFSTVSLFRTKVGHRPKRFVSTTELKHLRAYLIFKDLKRLKKTVIVNFWSSIPIISQPINHWLHLRNTKSTVKHAVISSRWEEHFSIECEKIRSFFSPLKFHLNTNEHESGGTLPTERSNKLQKNMPLINLRPMQYQERTHHWPVFGHHGFHVLVHFGHLA